MAGIPEASAHAELLRLATGCWVSRAIYVAAKLGIADLLRDEPKSCAMLAEASGTRANALYRVLRALASLGIFAEDDDGRFRLTALAEPLRTGTPGSLRAFTIMLGEREHWRSWEGMLHSVKTGTPAFEHVFGMPLFEYLAAHPGAAATFDDAMTSRSGDENTAIIAAYDFPDAGVLVDVGGGQGMLMASILNLRQNVQGMVVDLAHVIARSRPGLEAAVGAGRCEWVAGDFFSAVPGGGSLYLLKRIIHDWDDERAAVILANCRKAMDRAGRLLLIEPVIPAGNNTPSFNKLLDLLMLAWHDGGRERTETEHRALLAGAGFKLNRVISTHSGVSIIEAMPN